MALRNALFFAAGFAAGLVVAWVGARLLSAPPDAPAATASGLAPPSAAAGGTAAARAPDRDGTDDPERVWRQALRQQDSLMRQHELQEATFDWAWTSPRAALDAIESADEIDPQTRTALRARAVGAWAFTEPRAALDWALAWPDAQARSSLIGTALQGWASKDPRAAAQWLETQWNPTMDQHALSVAAAAYAVHHPEEAIEWLLALPARGAPWPMETVASTLAHIAPERADDLLAGIADADARDVAANALVRTWTATDAGAVMAWLERLADTDAPRSEALTATLLQEWAAHDIAGAMRHLDRLTDPGTRDNTVLAMLRIALDFDAALAESLFERIEADDVRISGAATLYEHLARTDPDRAKRYRLDTTESDRR